LPILPLRQQQRVPDKRDLFEPEGVQES
jgi:hypothetical protein